MNKFLSLMKITLINDFGLNKIFKKDKIFSKILTFILVILLYLIISFYFGFMLYGVGSLLSQNQSTDSILSMGLLLTSIILIITTLTRANAYLFKSKDFELLTSLSIPLHTIVLTKISSLLLFSYLTISVIYIPTIIVYALFTSISFVGILVAILGFILLPLLVITIFSVISYLISLILARFKYKNILSILLFLTFFVGISLLSFSSTNTDNSNITEMVNSLDKYFPYIYYPAYLIKEAILSNYLSLILLVIISIIPFILFIYYTSKVYVYVNSTLEKSVSNKKFNESMVSSKNSGLTFTLFKLELKKFFSYPMYVINSLTGKILMVVMTLTLVFGGDFETLTTKVEADVIALLIVLLILFTSGIMSTTSSTISLEGKNFWILKSLPVTNNQIFISKILIDLLFSIVLGFIAVTAAIIVIKPTILTIILMYLVLLLSFVHTSLVGLLANLKYNRLDWDLPIKVVKQSKAVFLTLIIGLLSVFLLIGLEFILSNLFNKEVFLLLIFALIYYIILLVLEIILLNKLGSKWFNEINS